jgi:nucleotide-binding universal stress UspA family protein
MVTLGGNRQAASADAAYRPLQIRHLVVPLDGSPLAESAIQPAASLARVLKAEVTLVRAYGGGAYLPSGGAMFRGRASATGDVHHASLYMARLQADLRSQGLRVSSRVVQAPAFEAILEVAAHAPAELIVLATRGGTGAGERSVAGSVAVDVIRNGEIPVLITNGATGNPFAQQSAGDLLLVVAEDDLHRNVTMGEYAAAIAREFRARITVLRSLSHDTCSTSQDTPSSGALAAALAPLRERGIEVSLETRGDRTSAQRRLGGFVRQQRAQLAVVSGRHAVPRPYDEAESLLDTLRESRAPVLFVP